VFLRRASALRSSLQTRSVASGSTTIMIDPRGRSGRLIAALLCMAVLAPGVSAAAPVVTSVPPLSLSPNQWSKVFDDPGLDALLERLERDNTSIAAAAARLAAARAHAALARTDSAPQLGLATSANDAAGPLINAAGNSGSLFAGTLGASWEPDLLGRLAPSRRADKADIRAAEADAAATRLLVEVRAARLWFAAIALDEARTRATEALALTRDVAAIAQARVTRGLASREYQNTKLQAVTDATDRLAVLVRAEAEARNALGYLVGEHVALTPPASHLPLPTPAPANISAEVIARRPDVAAAMARLEAADQRHSAARRDWLPRFALTGTGGGASAALSGLLAGGAVSFGLGLLASLPFLDGGRRHARIAQAGAARQIAEIQLRDVLLTAYHETNDTLARMTQCRSALDDASTRSSLADIEKGRVGRRLARGSASRAALTEASIASLEADNARSQRQADCIETQLALVLSLGGEWSAGI
jgi:outer membrane protein, multidrug efflux system